MLEFYVRSYALLNCSNSDNNWN